MPTVYSFFHRDGDHRDLHSFPTRRSSDLAKAGRTSPLFELTPLLEAPRRAVILYAEANCSPRGLEQRDRKSTRLNSSHVEISYAVFCLKKKKQKNLRDTKTRATRWARAMP